MDNTKIWSNWIVLLASAGLLLNAWKGFKTGSATLLYRTMKRSEDGYLFWIAVWLSAVLGVGCLLSIIVQLVQP